jgi:hypothetical protein
VLRGRIQCPLEDLEPALTFRVFKIRLKFRFCFFSFPTPAAGRKVDFPLLHKNLDPLAAGRSRVTNFHVGAPTRIYPERGLQLNKPIGLRG